MAISKRLFLLILLIATAGLLFVAIRQYIGFHHYNAYKNIRSEARSIQSAFPELETSLSKAVRAYKNPLFYKELGRLYLDRAQAEDKFGDPALRDAFLDKAAAAIAENIRRNPLDSWAYYDMGKIWMLYNAPLLTYADKARAYLRSALELNPSHDFLNLNVLYLFLIQWNSLTENEKAFVFSRIGRKLDEKLEFIGLLKRKWIENTHDEKSLKSILRAYPPLWRRIAGEFK
jgi:tetratricopeptide (TPR) repeat protein